MRMQIAKRNGFDQENSAAGADHARDQVRVAGPRVR